MTVGWAAPGSPRARLVIVSHSYSCWSRPRRIRSTVLTVAGTGARPLSAASYGWLPVRVCVGVGEAHPAPAAPPACSAR